ncbi:MAG: hypothetical protein IJG47_06185 [Microbacterium sp.]|nr:hypothetical protein [Microbacterium sp.]
MAKRTEKSTTWLTYAAARSTRLFGKGKVIPAVIAVLLGSASPFASTDDTGLESVAPSIFVLVTLFQAFTFLLLFRLHGQGARTALRVYYAIAAPCCLAVTVGAAFRPVTGPFLGTMMSVGLAAISFTAFYLLKNWDDLEQTRPDAAVFLGSTHALAFVAVAAATVRALLPESGEWVAALAQTTFLSLTALALPLAAGLWVRLSVHAHVLANFHMDEDASPAEDTEPLQLVSKETPPHSIVAAAEPQISRQDLPAAPAPPAPNNVAAAISVTAALVATILLMLTARRRA